MEIIVCRNCGKIAVFEQPHYKNTKKAFNCGCGNSEAKYRNIIKNIRADWQGIDTDYMKNKPYKGFEFIYKN